jgi:hypothetical protein
MLQCTEVAILSLARHLATLLEIVLYMVCDVKWDVIIKYCITSSKTMSNILSIFDFLSLGQHFKMNSELHCCPNDNLRTDGVFNNL